MPRAVKRRFLEHAYLVPCTLKLKTALASKLHWLWGSHHGNISGTGIENSYQAVIDGPVDLRRMTSHEHGDSGHEWLRWAAALPVGLGPATWTSTLFFGIKGNSPSRHDPSDNLSDSKWKVLKS